jgi:hypothetical protein
VVRRDGTLPAALLPTARARWRQERTPLRADGAGVDILAFDGLYSVHLDHGDERLQVELGVEVLEQ